MPHTLERLQQPTDSDIRRAMIADAIAADLSHLREAQAKAPVRQQIAPTLGEMVFITPHLVTKY